MKVQIPLGDGSASTSKNDQSTWFDDLPKEEQDKYLKEHPNSKYAKQSGLKRKVKRGVQKASEIASRIINKSPAGGIGMGKDKATIERIKASWRHRMKEQEAHLRAKGLTGKELTEELEKSTINHDKEMQKQIREWKKGAPARRAEQSKKILAQLDADEKAMEKWKKKSTSSIQPIQGEAMKVSIPLKSESAVGLASKGPQRTAPRHPLNPRADTNPKTAGVTAKPAKKKPAAKLVKPELKGLPEMKELSGKLNMIKFQDKELRGRFRDMDVYRWYNVNGEAALVVGSFIPTFKERGTRFAQMNSKNDLSQLNLKLGKYTRKGGSVEILIGTNHILIYTYAA